MEEIIRRVMKNKNVTVMEALIIYCEDNNYEPESIASAIQKLQGLKAELYEEAEGLRMVERLNRLPNDNS